MDRFSRALARTGRPMLFNVCDLWYPGEIDGAHPGWKDSAYAAFSWAPDISQSWRTDTDIGFPGRISFAAVLRNLDAEAMHPQAAGQAIGTILTPWDPSSGSRRPRRRLSSRCGRWWPRRSCWEATPGRSHPRR